MSRIFYSILLSVFGLAMIMPASEVKAQVDQDQLGAWYMYFYDARFGDSQFGVQGDAQFRNWDLGGDLEQLLLRSGLTWRSKENDIKLTLGLAHVTSGTFGESPSTSGEIRTYLEALLPQKILSRLYLNHRFRYEQRFVDQQDFRTRFRYNLFLTLPLNSESLEKGTVYASVYNELFINGQKKIGKEREVSLFDRNRFYSALGYCLSKKQRVQLGFMRQTLNSIAKNQVQLSFHHNI